MPLRPGLPVYEGDPPLRLRRYASLAGGSVCNLTRIDFGLHSGTHIDAPNHFIDGGAGVEATPIEALLGEAFVVDATAVAGQIDERALDELEIPRQAERVLFKTRNSRLWGAGGPRRDYTAITEGAARRLVERGVRLAGIDYFSIAPFADPTPTHLVLLRAGVVILEGLDLSCVAAGAYELTCLPLLIEGADGAPARAILSPYT